MDISLLVIEDPMCSSGYIEHGGKLRLLANIPPGLDVVYHTGVLAGHERRPNVYDGPDLEENPIQREKTEQMWLDRVHLSDGKLHPGFFDDPEFGKRRSTWEACAAVVAMRYQGDEQVAKMFEAIHDAFYEHKRNTYEYSVLDELATELHRDGLDFDLEKWREDLKSDETNEILRKNSLTLEAMKSHADYSFGFPGYILVSSEAAHSQDYSSKPEVLRVISSWADPLPHFESIMEELRKPDA